MMKENKSERYARVLVFLAGLLTCVFLYAIRSFDDNRLTSWEAAFNYADPLSVSIALVAGLSIAFLLSGYSFPERHPALSLFVLSLSSSAIFWNEPEVIVDASRYFVQAKYLELYGAFYFLTEWGNAIPVWTDMPLIPFLYGLVFRIIGEERLFIQCLTSLFFSCAVVITCLTGTRLKDKETGFTAGLLLLGIPYLYSQIPLMLVDIPFMFFLSLSVFLFVLALQEGGIMIGLSAVSITATLFAKYSSLLFLTGLPALFFAYMIKESQTGTSASVLRRGFGVMFLAGMLIGAIFYAGFGLFSSQLRFLSEYQGPGLRRWGEHLPAIYAFQLHPWIAISALLGLFAAFRSRNWLIIGIAWLPLLVTVLMIERTRYILPAFPMLCLIAASGLTSAFNERLRRSISWSIAASSIVVGFFVFLPFLKGISPFNLKAAGEFLNTLPLAAVEVAAVTPDSAEVNQAVSVPLLDLYTDRQIYFDYRPELLKYPKELKTSKLRFTWEYRNPPFYQDAGILKEGRAFVVVSGEKEPVLNEEIGRRAAGFQKSRSFAVSDDIYEHQSFVTVYHD